MFKNAFTSIGSISRYAVAAVGAVVSLLIVVAVVIGLYSIYQRAFSFTTWRTVAYELSYKSESYMDYSAIFTASQMGQYAPSSLNIQEFNTDLLGELQLTVVAKHPTSVVIAAQLVIDSVTFTMNGPADPQTQEAIRKTLLRPIFVRLSYDGAVRDVYLHESYDAAFPKSFARSLVAALQFIIPGKKALSGVRWKTVESDPVGEYHAEYHVIPTDSSVKTVELKKRKTSYIHRKILDDEEEIETPLVETENETTAIYNPVMGLIQSISSREMQRLSFKKHPIGFSDFSMTTRQKRIYLSDTVVRERLDSSWDTHGKSYKRYELYERPRLAEMQPLLYKTALGKKTLSDLVAECERLDPLFQKKKNIPYGQLYGEFLALIYLHPEECSAIVNYLSGKQRTSLAMIMVPLALSKIGHPKAQEALRDLAKKRASEELLLLALVPLIGNTKKPAKESEDFILEHMKHRNSDIATVADLSYGIMANRLQETDSDRSRRIVDSIIDRLDAAKMTPEKAHWLTVLGNARTPQAFTVIKKYVADHDSSLRGEAVLALRRVNSEEAVALTVPLLKGDADSLVRLRAAISLQYRTPARSFLALYRERLTVEPETMVRVQLIDNLWQLREEFPEAIEAIVATAERDKDRRVRQYALGYLERLAK